MIWHNKFYDPLQNGRKFWKGGDSSTTTVTPGASASSADAVNAWVASMPQVYETQMKYAPQEAAQQVQLAQQYALPLGQAYQQANEAMYPGITNLQNTLTNQAQAGSTATTMPDWMRKNYMSDYNSQIGANAGSGIGADYVSRGMQEQLFNQQKYYQNMGLSLTGRQPLTNAASPATTNYASTFTPANLMNFMNQKPVGSTSTTTSGGGGGLFGLF